MPNSLQGLHHVTAIASDPQRNIDFYTQFLGLRLVKKTVNFDDPSTYHLYYGNDQGLPGTLLTFFCWPQGNKGLQGVGQIFSVAFSVPKASLGYWIERCLEHHIKYEQPLQKFGDSVLLFHDPDGLIIELIASEDDRPGITHNSIPLEHSIRGLHNVTLCVESHSELEETLGFKFLDVDERVARFTVSDSATAKPGEIVDIRVVPDLWPARMGTGTIHHVAFQTTFEDQPSWLQKLEDKNFSASPVLDRKYFQSVYVRDSNGILFELATNGPGFEVDEPLAELGQNLCLPEELEYQRRAIEVLLPPLSTKKADTVPAGIPSLVEPPFLHVYQPGISATLPTLLLLHGSGGSEQDLLAFGSKVSGGSAMLSPRGKENESGTRFFRRPEDGVFDQKDIFLRSVELSAFVQSAAGVYGFNPGFVLAVGYSNGANIASSLLLLNTYPLTGAILLRPMPVLDDLSLESLPDLSGIPVLILAGKHDALVSAAQVDELAAVLTKAGAAVTRYVQDAGHEVTDEDVLVTREWLQTHLMEDQQELLDESDEDDELIN
jgi:predicted esterase/catechol 2,3-dioxygenase-like lactoylglutathione lyase family enzyme